jgi:hypothetical protein
MTALLIFLAIIFFIGIIAAPIIYLQARKNFREQKNYERGLKIVPLFIHLPPPSDDTDVGSRDARDVTDETISKAQIIYNIIAGTLKKGFKSEFYGQRHFAFEIVADQGMVYFYAAVPIALVEVVKQAINSAYPSARLEEVSEHNIFNPVGRISGTIGGELNLKEHFAYPIATYQDLKRDAMQSLLNALSTLSKEDGAAIQILMRPAIPSWRKAAHEVADKKRKGNKGLSAGGLAKDVASAFVKGPEGGSDNKPDKPDLSNLDQAIVDSIDEKTRHPGYEVAIRVIVSSNVSQRAQAILQNIVASFSLYDAPGKNGFKWSTAKDIDGLVTAYIMRFFPQHHNKNILNSVELATLFHFPDERNIPTSQLGRQDSKQVDGPRNIPEDGLLLGFNLFRGVKKPIRLALNDRQRHMYVVGQTGTGKSTFLENLALQDMLTGNGFAFVDPHGDTAEKLLSMVPRERTEDVIYFCPADMESPMGLNLFEFSSPEQKDFLIQEALNMLQKLYDPQHQGIMGPRYEHIFRNAALAVMADPAGGTFVDIPKLFRDPAFLKQKLAHVTDNNVLDYWLKEYPSSQRSNDAGEITAWFVSKFGAFLSNEMMRNIIGQTKSAFDLRDIMDNKKILLVNLSKGRTGDLNSKLLGMIFVMKFQAAAMSRADTPEDERIDFSLYVDEFQNFSTDSFATILSEARKYHLNLIVANQFTTQLTQEIRDAVFGNTGTIVSFRIGQNDVESLGKYFQPTFDSDDLLRVPNFNTIVRTMVGGVPTQPFSMVTLPALGTPNPRLSAALKQLAAAKYGKPKALVEQDINERMFGKTLDAGGQVGTLGTGLPPAAAPTRPAAAPPAQPGNFLDEWLNKRKQSPPAASAPITQPVAPPTSAPVASVAPTPAPMQARPIEPILPPPSATATIQKDANHKHLADPEPVEKPADLPVDPFQAAALKVKREPARPKKDSNNISSDELEKDEVTKIAAELKQQLDSPRKTEAAEHIFNLPKKPKATIKKEEETTPDDTIYIDPKTGNFLKADEKDKAKKEEA